MVLQNQCHISQHKKEYQYHLQPMLSVHVHVYTLRNATQSLCTVPFMCNVYVHHVYRLKGHVQVQVYTLYISEKIA